MAIEAAKEPTDITIRLLFFRPMKGEAKSIFNFTELGTGDTVVTWRMENKNSLGSKLFSLFIDFDKVLGAEFEKGLANLRALAETGARARSGTPNARRRGPLT